MALSSDLISQFVKITKDETSDKKETIVYGTVHKEDSSVFVKIDGSNAYTPVSTTSDTVEGERVIVMIKDHKAVITGNASSPSARSEDVKNVNITATEAKNMVEDTDTAVNGAYDKLASTQTSISQLRDMLPNIISVEDENGTRTSAMTPTDDGWTFDITNLLTSVNDLSEMIGYIAITTYGDKPCIELGKKGSKFKVRITNSNLQFLDGNVVPAEINNQMLNIGNAVVNDELQFGNFKFKKRDNGNMGLTWVG